MRTQANGIGKYPRTRPVGIRSAYTGGASFETLHRQQREREADGLPKVPPCALCRGLAMHYEGCPETWTDTKAALASYSGRPCVLGRILDAAA